MDQISSGNAFSAVEFAENPEPRVPCVLIVDTSTSMQGPRIDELNKGLKSYRDELIADPLATSTWGPASCWSRPTMFNSSR